MATDERKPQDIQERTLEYALRAIGLYRHLCSMSDDAARIIGKQYLRSATSIGANMHEAQSAESRLDFIHKCAIAQKEARESLYWLRLLTQAHCLPTDRLTPLVDETNQVLAVITAIIVNAKKNANL